MSVDVYKKKILPYEQMMGYVLNMLMDFLDIDCARQIVEYTAGDLIQFKQ